MHPHALLTDVKAISVTKEVAIDMTGYKGLTLIPIAVADPAAPITFTIKEGDTTTYANATTVDASQLLQSAASLDGANSTVKISYLGAKRYVFIAVSADPEAILGLLTHPDHLPVS